MMMAAVGVETNLPFEEDYFNEFMDKGKVTEGWLLTSTPYPVIATVAVYLLFVLRIGPRLMTHKQPYKLMSVMRLYNIFQVLYNLHVLRNGFRYEEIEFYKNNACTLIYSESDDQSKYAYLLYSWHYLVLKMLDLLDTVFLVLRKKDSNITFLHVFHHVSMVLSVWIVLTYLKSIHGVIPGLINVFVHMIMYAYFFLATFSQLKKYLWWKRHLTKLQMGQFVAILLYVSLLYYKGCQISRVFTYMCLGVVSIILFLFINFYRKTYGSRDPAERAKSS